MSNNDSNCPDMGGQEFFYRDADGHLVHYLGDFTGDEDDPTGLTALRDMLDAASPHLEAVGSPMAQLYASALASELDAIGVGH